MVKPAKKIDSGIHVAIRDHAELRRTILEAAKESVGFLQKHQKLEEMRQKKLSSYVELRAVLKEIVQLNQRLERLLPRLKTSSAGVKRELEAEFRGFEGEARPRFSSRGLDRLENELADIDSRMNELK